MGDVFGALADPARRAVPADSSAVADVRAGYDRPTALGVTCTPEPTVFRRAKE